MTTSAPPATALHPLLYGNCPPGYLHDLHRTLARHPFQVAESSAERGSYLHRRLTEYSRSLPPARELHSDPDRLAAALAWAAVADPRLAMSMITHNVLCLGSMVRLAPDHQALRREFDDLDAGRAVGSYLVTETGRASSHLAPRTTARFDATAREFVLETPEAGATKFGGVTTEPADRSATVLARVVDADGREGGVFPFLVDIADEHGPRPGIEFCRSTELSALPLHYRLVRFHGVRLPLHRWLRDDAWIDDRGRLHDPLEFPDARLQRTLSVGQGLWGVLPSMVAATSRQAAVLALRHARRRPADARLAPGVALIDYRSQQRALLGAFADAFALTCAAARARELLTDALATSAGRLARTAVGFAPWSAVSRPLSAYKAHTARLAERIVADLQRRCGLAGLLDCNRLSGYRGFDQAFGPAGGDSQLILYDLGRALVEDPWRGPEPGTLPSDLCDPQWWPGVLARHERLLAARLRDDRDALPEACKDPFAVWNPILDRAGELGETYAARLVAQDVPWAVMHLVPQDSPELRETVSALAALGALRAADRWAGALLRAGTLTPDALAPLAAAVDAQCDVLLDRLPLLEELFAFPSDISDLQSLTDCPSTAERPS